MPEYMLLIKSGPYETDSPEEIQKIVEKYIAWAQSLREKGHYVRGDELADTGRVMRVQDGKVVDGPFTETKEAVGGYFIIEAASYDEAVEAGRKSPVFDRGGMLEIREIIDHSA